jgi:hypothetical protein
MGNFNSSCCIWMSWPPSVGAPCQCVVHVCVIPWVHHASVLCMCAWFVGCTMSVCCACVRDSSPTAIITFYALRATHNNFSQNVEMCCFSCYLFWQSEWTCVCFLLYIYWLQKCLKNSVKVYLYECAPFVLLVSIKYQQWLPPTPTIHIVQTAMLFILKWWKNHVESSHLGDWKEDARITLKWTLGKLAASLGSGKGLRIVIIG